MKELICLILALLALLDSIVLTFRSNLTLGLVLVYLLTAALFLYLRFHRAIDAFCRQGIGLLFKVLFFAGLAFFVLLCGLMAYGSRDTATGSERAVIVLGAGLHGDVVSETLQRRLDEALFYHNTMNPDALIVVSGGMGPQETRTEAAAMVEYLILHGVPSEQVLLEDASTSTEENFRFSAALLAESGISAEDPVVFITNAFHCYRSAAYARQAGFAEIRCRSTGTSPWVIPSATLREALAICALWAKGG